MTGRSPRHADRTAQRAWDPERYDLVNERVVRQRHGHSPCLLPWVVWTASSYVMCIPFSKRETHYPWIGSVLPRSLPRGIPPLHLIVLEDIVLFVIQDIVLFVLVRVLHWGIQCEDVVLLVVLPFIEAFQRRFEGLHIFLILLNILNILEGGWDARCCWLLISLRWS